MSDWYVSDEKVRAILMAEGSMLSISDRLGVSNITVSLYKRLKSPKARRVYAQMVAEGLSPVLRGINEPFSLRRFTVEQVIEIRASKESSSALGKRYGCSSATIRMIKTRGSYRDV